MQILKRYCIDLNLNQRIELEKLGINLDYDEITNYTVFFIDINSELHNKFMSIHKELGIEIGLVLHYTNFLESEFNSAKYIGFFPKWINGYPMEDDDFGYRKTTYDDSKECQECGFGLVQKDSFYLRKEPNWGKRFLFNLNWVNDEIFAKKEFYEQVLKPLGIKSKAVKLYKKNTIIDSVVQLDITLIDVKFKKVETEQCKLCKNNRALNKILNKGFLPPLDKNVNEMIFKVNQNFGTGFENFYPIIISNELYQIFNQYKINNNYYILENN